MTLVLNFVFDLIIAILVYEYLKRDKKTEAYAAAVIIKVAYFLSSTLILGEFNFAEFVLYILVMVCICRLYMIVIDTIYSKDTKAILFIFEATLVGIIIMSFLGQVLHTLLFNLLTLFASTFNYTLQKIS